MKFLLILAPWLLGLTPGVSQALSPDWYSDFQKAMPACERELLCATGEGDTLADALGEARSEVAKFFQAKVQSKSNVSSSAEQKGLMPSDASIIEWTNKTISIETSELISGLEIRKQETQDGRIYVLMSLDRIKMSGLLKEKINELDTANNQLMALNSRFTYPKLLKNMVMIDFYNDRYSLLASEKISLKVKREMIQDKINKLTPVKMALITRGKKLPSKLNHTLIDLLSPLKVIVVAKKSGPSFILRGEIVTEEQYFKVSGFKKLNVVYKLELLNSKNEVIGKMSALSEQVARNSDHAIEKAIPDIKEALQDNLDQLSSK